MGFVLAGDDYVGSHHVLLSLLEPNPSPGGSLVSQVFQLAGLATSKLQDKVLQDMEGRRESTVNAPGSEAAEQKNKMIEQYKQYMASGGPQEAFPSMKVHPSPSADDDYDDIYN